MDVLKTDMLALEFDVAYIKEGTEYLPRFKIRKVSTEPKPPFAEKSGLVDIGLETEKFFMVIGTRHF